MKSSTKRFTGSVATLATLASVVAPVAVSAETMTVAKAQELVDYAVKTKVFAEYNIAYAAILALPAADQPALLAKLAPIYSEVITPEITAVIDTFKVVATEKGLDSYYDAYAKIEKTITNARNQQYLFGELTSWGKAGVFTEDVVAATSAINTLWATPNTANLVAAQTAVAAVKNAKSLAWCQDQLTQASAKVPVEIVSATATSYNTIKLTYNKAVSNASALDYDINGGISVTKAELSSDKKTVTLTVGPDLVDGVVYTVKVLDENGDETGLSTTVKYDVAQVESVELTKTSFEVGEDITDYVVVKDEKGLIMSAASYQVTNIESSDVSVIDTDGKVLLTGPVNLRIEVTFKDDSTYKSDFISVTAGQTNALGNNQGFALTDAATTAGKDTTDAWFNQNSSSKDDTVYENTVKFNAAKASAKTTLSLGDAAHYLNIYHTDKAGNPLASQLDLIGDDYTVTSKNSAIVAVSKEADGYTVKPISIGTATIEVKNTDTGYKQTFSIAVQADPEYKEFTLSDASIKLVHTSADAANAVEEHVNQETVDLKWVDQYGKARYIALDEADINEVSSNKIELTNLPFNEDGKIVVSADSTAFTVEVTSAGKIVVKSVEGKTVNSASLKVTYYKDASDSKATTTKTIPVTIVAKSTLAKYEIVPARTAIDATPDNSSTYAYTTFTVYAVDKNGVRIDDVTAEMEFTITDNHWVELVDNKLQFVEDSGAGILLGTSSTINVEYGLAGSGKYGKIAITYGNDAMVPTTATVATAPVLINTAKFDADYDLTMRDLLFGAINTSELNIDAVNDDFSEKANPISMGIKIGADGYKFNAPVISIKDQKSAAYGIGPSIYGIETTDVSKTSNFLTADGTFTGLDATLDVVYEITNVNGLVTTTTDLDNVLTVADDATRATFTVVVKKVTVAGDTRSTVKNLLAAPVAFNVTLLK